MKKVVASIRKLLHFLASIFMYSVLLLMILIFITVIVYVLEQKQNIAKDRYVAPLFSAYVIITNSMDPAIAVNDVVIDRRVLPSELKVGDVITFVSNDPIAFGKTITHRITGRDQDKDGFHRFRTKGDNNNVEDNWIVSETNILGRVMFKIPKLGYIQQFLATSYGWIAAIVLPCLIIIIYDIVKLLSTIINSSKRKKDVKIGIDEEQITHMKNGNAHVDMVKHFDNNLKEEKDIYYYESSTHASPKNIDSSQTVQADRSIVQQKGKQDEKKYDE